MIPKRSAGSSFFFSPKMIPRPTRPNFICTFILFEKKNYIYIYSKSNSIFAENSTQFHLDLYILGFVYALRKYSFKVTQPYYL